MKTGPVRVDGVAARVEVLDHPQAGPRTLLKILRPIAAGTQAVIDVDMDSPNYGRLINKLDLGSAGNETHHFGFTDDRTHIWGCSLFSSRLFLYQLVVYCTDPAEVVSGSISRIPCVF